MFAIKFYPLDCKEILSYTIQDLLAKKFILKLFLRAIYSTINGRVASWSKYFSWRLYRSQRKNIEIYEEINEGIIIEEDHEIKNNVGEINEDPSIYKDLEVEIVETIKEKILEEVGNDLDEIKLDDCNNQTPIILVEDTETKFIDFIGVERFDLIIGSYMVNVVNYIKIKGEEVQVAQLMIFKFGKKTKKMKYSKYLFSWHERFQISKINSRTSLFQVEGSNVDTI